MSGGRPRLYRFDLLAIGEDMLIEWKHGPDGRRARDQESIHAAIRQHQIKTGKRFDRKPKPAGLRVTRTA